jgi:titin
VATKYFARKPINHKGHHYRPGDEITGFTGWWRYWQYLRYARVNQVDTFGAPVLGVITPGNETLSLAVTGIEAPGGDPFTNFEYQLDAGSWVPFDPPDVLSPFLIDGLTNGTTYAVRVRGVNAAGAGTQSNSVNGTPRTVPSAPTDLVATPGDQELSIAFTPGDDGGSAITNYQYRVAPSTTYIAFDPVDTTSPVVITGLTNDVEVTVYIRAINAAGNGASASVTGTPTV